MDLTSGIRELYDVIYKIAKSVFYYSMINAHRHVFWMGWPNKKGFEKTCWSRSNRYLKAWIMKFNQLRLHFFLAFDKHIVINNFLDKQYRKKKKKKTKLERPFEVQNRYWNPNDRIVSPISEEVPIGIECLFFIGKIHFREFRSTD